MSQENLRLPPAQPETAYLSDSVTLGLHAHRTQGEDCSVYYMDDSRGIRRMVVDGQGQFCDFPVIITEEFWVRELQDSHALKNQIRFRTSFEKINNGFLVLWCVQPDGRYWEDHDGFGGSSHAEIVLYSFLDDEGKICAPFRLYRLGTQNYYSPQDKDRDCPSRAPVQEPPAPKKSILNRIKENPKPFKEIMWILTVLGNAVIFFIIGFMATDYDTYYGKTNPYSSVFEYMLDDILWVFFVILLVYNLITLSLALFFPLESKKQKVPPPAKETIVAYPQEPMPKEPAPEEPQSLGLADPVEEEDSGDMVEQLERLKGLLDNGTITKKEFKTLKQKLLK